MGTETVSESVMDNGYEDSDDDKRLVFKRKSNVTSNSNQSKSNLQRSKAVPSSKVSPMRSPVTSPNGTTPSNRTSIVKSSMPSCSSKASPAKSPLRNDTPSTVKDRSQSHKDQSECKSEHEDSEDDKPISFIRSRNSSRPNKGPSSSRQVSLPQPEKKNSGDRPLDRANGIIKDESDDEAPISLMYRKKNDSGMSGAKQVSIDEKKPLAKKLLSKETRDGDVPEKVVVYQQANKEVAIICNHQRTVSKSHGAQVEKLAVKIEELREQIKELNIDLDRAKKGRTPLMGSDGKRKRNLTPEALEKKIMQTQGKIEKMERDMRTKEDMKTVALGTSKINYMDPRITVAWCKRHDVPIEKIFNKSLLAKFSWAMDVDPEFRFCLSSDE
ncbi:PREDICTED: DNA topoisomerase 1 alpha [Camelina sativa]|uniref:DNA topoisomerase 1 alpha n=1 Tax=Camelina sativa TaxID=90675 RepID=A0ABM0XA83_CAMSA|nr:PREDICTED: DNA topoisomerase 1 alpha [Camelina sativa]